jgi:hypothetical protein
MSAAVQLVFTAETRTHGDFFFFFLEFPSEYWRLIKRKKLIAAKNNDKAACPVITVHGSWRVYVVAADLVIAYEKINNPFYHESTEG